MLQAPRPVFFSSFDIDNVVEDNDDAAFFYVGEEEMAKFIENTRQSAFDRRLDELLNELNRVSNSLMPQNYYHSSSSSNKTMAAANGSSGSSNNDYQQHTQSAQNFDKFSIKSNNNEAAKLQQSGSAPSLAPQSPPPVAKRTMMFSPPANFIVSSQERLSSPSHSPRNYCSQISTTPSKTTITSPTTGKKRVTLVEPNGEVTVSSVVNQQQQSPRTASKNQQSIVNRQRFSAIAATREDTYESTKVSTMMEP